MNQSISPRELFQRYTTFIGSLFVIALGVSLTIRADLGSSPISVLPYVWSMAQGISIHVFGNIFTVPRLTLGEYTICMHVILISLQILLLRKDFKKFQLLQIVAGIIFGFFIDLTMVLTIWCQWGNSSFSFIIRFVQMLIGGGVLGFGIACEVRCNTLVLPGEGFPVALAQILHSDFGKVKIFSDTSFVIAGVAFCYLFFGAWQWKMIGIGTLISMVYVGAMVRFFSPRINWLDYLLLDHREQKIIATATAVASSLQATPLVITIAREYGSGGHEIGEKLAAQLGVNFYDRKIIDDTAEVLGFKPEFVKEKEQKITNSKLLELIITDKQIPMNISPSEDDAIFVTQSRIIRNMATNDSCVIIGRCADYILKDNPNCFNIFVLSDIDFAKKRIADECNLSPEEAEKKILYTNHTRANHYWQYTGKKWNDPRHYDLVINSSSLGIDRAVNIIIEAVKSQCPIN